MRRYETLILAVPEITADESSWLELELTKMIENFKGKTLSFDRWGKYRLAYPVRKNDYGVYFLVRFELSDEKYIDFLKEKDEFFKVKAPEVAMRELTSVLDPGKSLEYQKPASLEDMPTKDVDSFLRDNKMHGFVSKKHSSGYKKDDSFTKKTDEKSVSSENVVVKKEEKSEAKTAEPDKTKSDSNLEEKKATPEKKVTAEKAKEQADPVEGKE